MFNIGDKIVYPMHGAGEIIAIEEREILGNVHKYYIMRLPINELKVMVPGKSEVKYVKGRKFKEILWKK